MSKYFLVGVICQNKEKGFFATTGFFVKTRLLSMASSPARFEDKPWSGAKKQQNQLLAKRGAKGHRRQNRAKENQPKRQRRGISGQWRERERKVQLDTEEISFFSGSAKGSWDM